MPPMITVEHLRKVYGHHLAVVTGWIALRVYR
jgi:hypothetical protein